MEKEISAISNQTRNVKDQNKENLTFTVPPFIRADQLRSALLHFTVYLIGGCFLVSLYFMLVMIRPYFSPLFWAAVLSVPLHSVKKSIISSIETSWEPSRRKYTSVKSMAFSLLQLPLQLLLGPLWKYILIVSERFGTVIGNLSRPVEAECDSNSFAKTRDTLNDESLADQIDSTRFSSGDEIETFVLPAPRHVGTLKFETPNRKRNSLPDIQATMTPSSQVKGPNSSSGSIHNKQRSNTVDSFNRSPTRKAGNYGSIALVTPAGPETSTNFSAPSTTTSVPFGSRRVVSYNSIYRPLSPTKFSYAAQTFSTSEFSSVVDSVVGNLRTAPSSAYFAFLVRCSLIYGFYLVLISTSQEWLIISAALLVSSIFVYVSYHFVKGVYVKKIIVGRRLYTVSGNPASPAGDEKAPAVPENPFVVSPEAEPDGNTSIVRQMHRCLSQLLSTILLSGYHMIYNRIDLLIKDRNRLNNFITVVLIISATTLLLLLTIFVSFKITQEANSLVDLVLEHIYENEAMKEQFRSVVNDLRGSALQYFDAKLAEFAPGTNITAAFLVERLREGYYSYFTHENSHFSSTSVFSDSDSATAEILETLAIQVNVSNNSILALNSTFPVDGALAPSRQIRSRPHTLIPGALKKFLRELVFKGNFSVLYDVELLKEIYKDFQAGALSAVQSLWYQINGFRFNSAGRADKPDGATTSSGVFVPDTSNSFAEEFTKDMNSTMAFGRLFTAHFASFAAQMFSSSLSLLGVVLVTVFQLVYYGLDLIFQCVLFFVTLYSLLKNEESIIHYVSRLLLLVDAKQKIRASIEGSIQNVLVVTVKLMLFHMLFVWLTFSIFSVEFPYTAMLVSAILSILPLTSQIWVALPAVFNLWMQGKIIQSIVLFLLHVLVSWVVDAQIYREIKGTNPFFSVLFIVLGFNQFGFEGLLWGPLIGTIPFIAYQLYGELTGYSLGTQI